MSIQRIKSSRKEYRCSKCGQVIPKGDPYLRGEVNFGPTIIRCTKCGLKSYEVTTSDYIQQVGPIVYEWETDYGLDESTPAAISEALSAVRDDVQDRLDNMPESLQYSPTGEMLQERIDQLESAIDELDDMDIESIRNEVAENEYNEADYDEAVQIILSSDEHGDDKVKELDAIIEDEIRERISAILDEIEV